MSKEWMEIWKEAVEVYEALSGVSLVRWTGEVRVEVFRESCRIGIS